MRDFKKRKGRRKYRSTGVFFVEHIVALKMFKRFGHRSRLTAATVCRRAGNVAGRSFSADLRVAVVGSGPAGFYTTKYLLKDHPGSTVDIFEALPVPFGLVRYGVAPDHPEVKSVQKDFSNIASDERVRYWGNVKVGEDVAVSTLRDAYDCVVFAHGADGDRFLNIPGEKELAGVYTSREFVNWYNGLPEHRDLDVDLSGVKTVAIVGQGNVAIDCARILGKRIEDIKSTDIAEHAVDILSKSAVENVYVIGRRGHVQAAFTMKEMRELTQLAGCDLIIDEADLENGRTDASKEEIKQFRAKKRMDALLQKHVESPKGPGGEAERSISLRFFRSPTAMLPREGNLKHVGALQLEKTKLEGPAGSQRAVVTDKDDLEIIPCDMVITGVGYQSTAMEGLPFDHDSCVVPNARGRVHEGSAKGPLAGVYCSGWVKRGPSGIIGTNIMDARETVRAIVQDISDGLFSELKLGASHPGMDAVLTTHNVVDWDGYSRIDQLEMDLGEKSGKDRVKLVDVETMLEVSKVA